MVDFEMTNSGDLKLSSTEHFPSFNISWYETEFPAFCIKWEQLENPLNDEPADNALLITFTTDKGRTGFTKTVAPVRHNKELAQRLTILLRTELGGSELSPSLGTTLALDKHKDICELQVVKSIQKKILTAIEGLVNNPAVVLKVEEKDGPFYCQNINVYIYQDNDLIYETSIGG